MNLNEYGMDKLLKIIIVSTSGNSGYTYGIVPTTPIINPWIKYK